MDLLIRRVEDLPDDMRVELIPSAAEEGFKPMGWLVEEWEHGTNRFALPGEALYEARWRNRLVGICGLNRDPFSEEDKVGRLRRLYVLPEFRRKGVGRQLVLAALRGARNEFGTVRLMTMNAVATKFFEVIGFRSVEGEHRVSHAINIDP